MHLYAASNSFCHLAVSTDTVLRKSYALQVRLLSFMSFFTLLTLLVVGGSPDSNYGAGFRLLELCSDYCQLSNFQSKFPALQMYTAILELSTPTVLVRWKRRQIVVKQPPLITSCPIPVALLRYRSANHSKPGARLRSKDRSSAPPIRNFGMERRRDNGLIGGWPRVIFFGCRCRLCHCAM